MVWIYKVYFKSYFVAITISELIFFHAILDRSVKVTYFGTINLKPYSLNFPCINHISVTSNSYFSQGFHSHLFCLYFLSASSAYHASTAIWQLYSKSDILLAYATLSSHRHGARVILYLDKLFLSLIVVATKFRVCVDTYLLILLIIDVPCGS